MCYCTGEVALGSTTPSATLKLVRRGISATQSRWCRTERAARELSTRSGGGGYVIVIESATHQTLMWTSNRMSDAPGEGEFTLDADRVGIGRMITQMVWSKLLHFLERREFHNYRFLLNSHAARYFRALDVEPIDGLVPGFQTRIDPSVDVKGFMLDRFLHQNGFRSFAPTVPSPQI